MPPNSTPACAARDAALARLHAEHRGLAKIIDALQSVTAEIAEGTLAVDFTFIAAMLYYVDGVPERMHHPKEERFLFTALEQRDPESGPVLARLRAEHARSPALIAALEAAMVRWQGGAVDGYDQFEQALQVFCDFHWTHMRTEEEQVLPRAERCLHEDDWVRIADAWAENDDPLFGPARRGEFDRLYQRIANLAPRRIKRNLRNGSAGTT